MGIGWIILCVFLFAISGEARLLVLIGLMIATLFLLGLERLIKMVLGRN